EVGLEVGRSVAVWSARATPHNYRLGGHDLAFDSNLGWQQHDSTKDAAQPAYPQRIPIPDGCGRCKT
ncbi:MAG: hypothetical protein ABIV13_07230, partial [Fimbriimonadales bacterium]